MPAPTRSWVYRSGEWEIDLARRELRLRGVPTTLGSRAFEVVEVLVQSGGELVDKYDLMNRVWPGAVVEENTLQAQISALRRTFGADRELLKTIAGRGYRLLGDWAREETIAGRRVTTRAASGFIANLPAAANTLVGRTAALTQLSELVSSSRMVTLAGPGGIGKTVLALECARALLAKFQGNCLLVELASISDAGLVPSKVASSLGLKLGGGSISSETIAKAIGSNKILLVLDSCEHLIDAAAELAETLIARCAHLSILATSREVLRIDGECVYRVPPLDVPPEYSGEESRVLDHSAAQLLLARIRAQDQDFCPRGAQFRAIAAICRRLDGIPLAIEFAAARAATLGLEQVAKGLDDLLAVLTGGRRTALPRHQTIRATLDWSYRLLSDDERSLLRRLSVFAGGFTLEAALRIAGEEADDDVATADGIANLVAKSLISHDPSRLGDRWQLLETIRAYALEKLQQAGEDEATLSKHARFLDRLIESAAKGGTDDKTARWPADYVEYIDDVRSALRWAFSPTGDRDIGISLTVSCVPLWINLSLLEEGRRSVETALAAIDQSSNPDQRIPLLAALAMSRMYIGSDIRELVLIWKEALALATRTSSFQYQIQ